MTNLNSKPLTQQVEIDVPGVHPWFGHLAVLDWLADHGYQAPVRVEQIGGCVYRAEVPA